MPGEKIEITIEPGADVLQIYIPAEEISPVAKIFILKRTGEKIYGEKLKEGRNSIDLRSYKDEIIVVRVETAYETIVKELRKTKHDH